MSRPKPNNSWNLDDSLLENESQAQRNIARKVSQILDYMKSLDISLPVFLSNLVGIDNPACTRLMQCSAARGTLYRSDALLDIMRWWLRHPNNRSGPKASLRPLIVEEVTALMNKELEAFDERMVDAKPTHDELVSFDFAAELQWAKDNMGIVWNLLHTLATTERGRRENTKKSPDMFILVAISQLSYSRSNRQNKMAQVFAIFFQGIGLPSRAFEVLHQLCICMSQRWADLALSGIADSRMDELAKLVQTQAIVLSGDNVNIAHKIFSQRVYNRNIFDSGTAATAFVLPRQPLPASVAEDFATLAQKHKTITLDDFYDNDRTERIQDYKVHQILTILMESTWFSGYSQRDDYTLRAPDPVHLTPRGRKNKMRPFVLRTMKIDQSSFEGNLEWTNDVLKQMGFFETEEARQDLAKSKILNVVGDELTQKCLKGLKRFRAGDRNALERMDFLNESIGWFHAVMTLAQQIWHVHAGSRLGTGLLRDVALLNRIHFRAGQDEVNGSSSGSNNPKFKPHQSGDQSMEIDGHQGNASGNTEKNSKPPSSKQAAQLSYHDLDELVTQVLKAYVLNAWLTVAGFTKLEQLETWNPTPQTLKELATRILRDFASSKALQQDDVSSIVSKARPKKQSRTKAVQRLPSDLQASTMPSDPASETSFSEASNQLIIFENGVRFMRDALNYYALRMAIREGDVGRIEDSIRSLAVMFKGGGHPKYAILMTETLQKLENEYPEELRNFVKDYCWVISRTGMSGTFHPVDQAQEHVNLQLKVVHSAKGPNSSWEHLAKMSPAIPTYQGLAATIGRGFPTSANGTRHTSPDDSLDIKLVVERLQQDRVMQKTVTIEENSPASRRPVQPTIDVFALGWKALATSDFLKEWKEKRRRVISKDDLWNEVIDERDVDGVPLEDSSDAEMNDASPDSPDVDQNNEVIEEDVRRAVVRDLYLDLDPALALALDLERLHVLE